MTARVSRSFLKAAKGKGLVRVETKHSTLPRGSVGWPDMHLDGNGSGKRGRFAVSAKSARTADGIVFDSKGEMTRYTQLRLLERAGRINSLERQPSWDIMINGQKLCTYSADFSYFCKERNRSVIEDIKSSGTQKDAAYRLRKRAAELYCSIKVDEVLI